MKIRSVHLKGHSVLGDISVDVRGEDGVVPRSFGIWGGTGTGKTLLFKMIRAAWTKSVLGRDDYELYPGATGYVTFEADDEVYLVRVQDGVAEGNAGLGKLSNLEKIQHCLTPYGSNRIGHSSEKQSLGERNVYWLMRDALWSGVARDSIVLVDDFDVGLDSFSRERVYYELFKLHGALGNQVILTGIQPVSAIQRYVALNDRKDDWVAGLREKLKMQH